MVMYRYTYILFIIHKDFMVIINFGGWDKIVLYKQNKIDESGRC